MAEDDGGPREGFDKVVELFGDVERKLEEIKVLILEINARRADERIARARDAAAAARSVEKDGKPVQSGSDSETLYCSFCGKSQHEVAKLVAGPDVFICDECIELCADIVRVEKKVGKD